MPIPNNLGFPSGNEYDLLIGGWTKFWNEILKREITWEEAAAEYKGIYSQLGKNKKADEIMKDLRGFHKRLKDQRK